MKLYVYDHCPYCIRVKMLINLKKLDIEIKTLAYDDEATPIKMIGQKMLPILEKEDGSFMPESMDIVEYLDNLSDERIINPSNNDSFVGEAISEMMPAIYRIAMPRWTTISLKEFETENAKNYFINHKTLSIGPFEEAINNTEKYQSVILAALENLNNNLDTPMGDHFIEEKLTKNDIYLFSTLLSLTSFRKFKWPNYAQSYMRFMSEKTGIYQFTK